MNNKLIIDFLVKSTIPAQKKYPDFVNKDNKRIWDAVYRAHRDVLTGRAWIPIYCNNYGQGNDNQILECFFKALCKIQCSSSMGYIEFLELEFSDVEFGAVQKLVNMTLKYIIIYNEMCNFGYPINEKDCDCPLDSIILDKLSTKHTPWTKMGKEEYIKVQEEIKIGLKFDFEKW